MLSSEGPVTAKRKRKGSLPARARSTATDEADQRREAMRSRSRTVPVHRVHHGGAEVVWVLSLAAVAALLAAVGVAYDSGLFAPYFLSRSLPLLPLALTLVLLALVRVAPGVRPCRIDALDVAVLGFAAWQTVSALASPTFTVAFFGYYNRGAGAVFWFAVGLLFVAARRLLGDTRSLRPLVWIVSAVLVLAGSVAVAQAFGATGLWGGVAGLDRLTGTTGNPISLGGLGLLAVWLGAGLPGWRLLCATWVVAAAGSLAGVTAVVLSVSRAAMAALLVCGIFMAVVWLRRRPRAALVTAAAVSSVIVLIAVGYAAGPGTSLLTRLSSDDSGGLSSSDDKRVELWGRGPAGDEGLSAGRHGVRRVRRRRPAVPAGRTTCREPLGPGQRPAFAAARRRDRVRRDRLADRRSGVLASRGPPMASVISATGRRGGSTRPPDQDPDGAAVVWAAGAGLLYLAAAAVFSLCQPNRVRRPRARGRHRRSGRGCSGRGQAWYWRLGASRRRGAGRAVMGVLVAVTAGALVVSRDRRRAVVPRRSCLRCVQSRRSRRGRGESRGSVAMGAVLRSSGRRTRVAGGTRC